MNIYIDGAADVGKKLIGYAAFDEKGKEVCSGWDKGEGSNTAELTAIYEVLKKCPHKMMWVYTDSNNVLGWLNLNWKAKQPNIQSLLSKIEEETKTQFGKNLYTLGYFKVEGHSGVWQNELADKRAKEMLDFARKCPANN